MRTHIISVGVGLIAGLLLSGVLDAQEASAKKTPKKAKEVSCWDTAGSQVELNQCAARDTDSATRNGNRNRRARRPTMRGWRGCSQPRM